MIRLLDAIAVHWLNSIDKRLISIIKTEFATQKTKRLCQMIKPIAKCVDEPQILVIMLNMLDY